MARSFSFRRRLPLVRLLSLVGLIVCWAGGTVSPAAGPVFPRPTQFPPTAEIPPGICEALLDGCRQVAAATTLDAIAAARDSLDRLSERQRDAGCTWLVAVDDVAFALDDLLAPPRRSSADLAWPLDRVLARLHWRLAAATSAASDKASRVAFENAAGAALPPTPGGAVVAARLAAGDRAVERGWETAATAAWRDAQTIALWMHHPIRAQQAADRLAALSALQAATAPSSTARQPAVPPVAGPLLWQHRLPMDNRQGSGSGPAAVPLSLSAAVSSKTGPLVCWHTSSGIHARRLSDGGVPWHDAAAGPSSDRLFPPAGDTPIAAPVWPPCLAGGRLLSVLTQPNGLAGSASSSARPPLLVCLDITDATEGRLEWSTPLPAAMADGVGQPVCGHGDQGEELAFLCLRGVTDELVAVRLSDGQLLWRRPLSRGRNAPLGRSHDGGPSASPHTPILSEDLVLVATDDGCVWAVDGAGDLVWVERDVSERASAQTALESRETPRAPVTLTDLGESIARNSEPASRLAMVTGHSRVVVCDGVSIQVFELPDTD